MQTVTPTLHLTLPPTPHPRHEDLFDCKRIRFDSYLRNNLTRGSVGWGVRWGHGGSDEA